MSNSISTITPGRLQAIFIW